ncbi:MAG: exosortase system-associated protein, TIGR04073 family [Verrucomicrobiae bacterium]|nr:exosortase system-associated protein, TIGR04073 family [Verrucomicrobiae bacterium]
MQRKLTLALLAGGVVWLTVGCSGPEKKLGRGLTNATEFARMGEMRRSVEQSALFDGVPSSYSTGVIHGFNRSVLRTLVGAYEIVTFPIPSYDPVLKPGNRVAPDMGVDPTFPDSHHPGRWAQSTFDTDTALGFSGGDVAPFIPGSRFHIFDY